MSAGGEDEADRREDGPEVGRAELDVVGIGNALVDVLVETDAALIEGFGLTKGSMMLMGLADAERVHAQAGTGVQRSGGSAANTIAGLAALGARTGFIGRVADDRLGESFSADIRSLGVAFRAKGIADGAGERSGAATGRCLILITPDADRTMCTSLGVAAELDAEDIDASLVRGARLTYLEGYLFDLAPAKSAFRHAIAVAHDAGRQVAMSLSDPFCVARHREDFLALVVGELDVLFSNEEEICSLVGTDDVHEACRRVRRSARSGPGGLTLTVTLGAAGSLVWAAGDAAPTQVPAGHVERVVDTTGAGDLYASGFLWGVSRGYEPERCARIGCVTAAEIISHVGARPEADLTALVAGV